MKNKSQIKCWLIIVLCYFIIGIKNTYAQESNESLQLNIPETEFSPNVLFLFNQAFSNYYPLAGEESATFRKYKQLLNEEMSDMNVYPNSTNAASKYDDRMQYLRNPYYLQTNYYFSLGEKLGWDYLDVFYEFTSELAAPYEVGHLEYLMSSGTQRKYSSSASLGIGYNVKPNTTIFIKANTQFIGNQRLNKLGENSDVKIPLKKKVNYVGGVKMKF